MSLKAFGGGRRCPWVCSCHMPDGRHRPKFRGKGKDSCLQRIHSVGRPSARPRSLSDLNTVRPWHSIERECTKSGRRLYPLRGAPIESVLISSSCTPLTATCCINFFHRFQTSERTSM